MILRQFVENNIDEVDWDVCQKIQNAIHLLEKYR